MMRAQHYQEVGPLLMDYERHREPIVARLRDFAAVQPSDYFYELVYCLLTPQSSARHAGRAVELLRGADLLASDMDPVAVLASKSHYIRFHNTKAKRLLEAKQMLPEILALLAGDGTSAEMRAWLTRNVKGLGWKEASHFLRNIGHRDLAILDRHILKNLRRHGVIREIPRSLTPVRYLAVEKKFSTFARTIGIPMDELDLLFWSKETGEILK